MHRRAGGGTAPGSHRASSVSSCLLGTHAVSIALQPACQEVTWLLSREGVLQSGDVFNFQWSEEKKLLA